MAIYVTSDLHGLLPEKLERLLQKVGFSDSDWLYILGDAIDRENDGGTRLLLWCLAQPNVQLLLGNHEAMLLSCRFVLDEITEESIAEFDAQKLDLLQNYTLNGGDCTLKALRELNLRDRETVQEIFDYLEDAPLYETVEAGGKDFVLVHGGLENFSPDKKLSEYTADELIWCWPNLDDEYFSDAITVFGHTPTAYFGAEYRGKILKTKTWIDVDVGVPYGNSPALLRLDDLEEFYL